MRSAGWKKHKLESRLLGEISIIDDTTDMAESEEGLKCLLMNMKEESEKIGLIMNNAIFLLGKNEGRRRRG